MDYRDKLISKLAKTECKRISRKIMRRLMQMDGEMQSGDDSSLKNLWDEICVQVQGEQSIFWSEYLDTVQPLLLLELKKVNVDIKQSIWLQTDEGFDWYLENENADIAPFSDEDISTYIMQEFVLSIAANYNNKRIEKYLDREFDY